MPTLASRQVTVIVNFAVLNALALVAVGLRLYARAFIRRDIQAHDILTLISLVMLIGYTICLLIATVNGGLGIPVVQAIASGFNIVAVLKNISLEGSCGDAVTAELAAAVINMVLDIIAVLLPIPIIWKLQMATEKKVAVTATFGLGLV
ncbi:hypothetical protein ABHI18_009457 [Aspergillus niger]